MGGGGPSGGTTTQTSQPATIAPELQPLVSASATGTIAGQKALPLTGTPTGTYYDPTTGLPTASPYGAFTALNPMQVPQLTPMENIISSEISAYPFAMDPNLALGPLSQAPTPTPPMSALPPSSPLAGGTTSGTMPMGGPSTGAPALPSVSTPYGNINPSALPTGISLSADGKTWIDSRDPGGSVAYYDFSAFRPDWLTSNMLVTPTTPAPASPSSPAPSSGPAASSGGPLGVGPGTTLASTMGVPSLDPNLTAPFDLAKLAALQTLGPLSGQANYAAMKDDFTRNMAPLVESTAVGKGYSPTSGAMLESLGNAAASAVAPLEQQRQSLIANLVPSMTALGTAEPATILDTLKQAETAAALPRTVATSQSQADYNAFQQLLDLAKQLTLGPTQTVLPGMITAGPSTTTQSSPSGFSK